MLAVTILFVIMVVGLINAYCHFKKQKEKGINERAGCLFFWF